MNTRTRIRHTRADQAGGPRNGRAARGFALVTAILVGALLVVFVATGTAYLLGSTHLLSTDRIAERAANAARAGLSLAIAKFDDTDPAGVATSDVAYDQAEYTVQVEELDDVGYVLTSEGWVPGHESKKRVLRMVIEAVNEFAQYAIAAGGDVTLRKHSFVGSLPEEGQADVRTNGDASLLNHSSADGVVSVSGAFWADKHSHAWQGSKEGASKMKLPVYSKNQLDALREKAEEYKSVQIQAATYPPANSKGKDQGDDDDDDDDDGKVSKVVSSAWGSLPAEKGELAGYYYSYPGYDSHSAQTNGATLTLAEGSYTLDGVMVVAGKLKIDKHVKMVGEGQIIVTEGISISNHVTYQGTTLTAHSDLVSVYGDISVSRHVNLGQLPPTMKGRRHDQGDDDEDGKEGPDDDLWKNKRDAYWPGTDWIAMAWQGVQSWALPAAWAKDDDDGDDDDGGKPKKGDDDDDGAATKVGKIGKDLEDKLKHLKFWTKKYKGTLPVGCTVWSQRGDVTFEKQVTLVGNIVAGGQVLFDKKVDLVRNTDDPVLSAGMNSWQSTSNQTVK